MELFRQAGVGRQTNDANNTAREFFLMTLYHNQDPSVQSIRDEWNITLNTLCPVPYDDIEMIKRGGRRSNHDFEIRFLCNGAVVHTVKAEFKHNASKINKLPQYYDAPANKPYTTTLYADFFYNYLDRICEIYPGLSQYKPTREDYVKLVHSSAYNRHIFFQTLYQMQNDGTALQASQKRQIAHESVKEYLKLYASTLNLEILSREIRERQTGKVFILWNFREFKFIIDSIRDDEMEITHIEGVKNNNTIVVVSKCGTKHNLRLRWKNNFGILMPAWQISLTR